MKILFKYQEWQMEALDLEIENKCHVDFIAKTGGYMSWFESAQSDPLASTAPKRFELGLSRAKSSTTSSATTSN